LWWKVAGSEEVADHITEITLYNTRIAYKTHMGFRLVLVPC